MIEEVRLFYAFMRFPIRLRLLADIGQNAAVHVEDVAVDEVGRVGSEEHGRALEVLRLAPARGRGLGDDELVKRMTAAVRLDLAQGSGLERMAKVVTTIHDLVGD